MGNRKLTRQQAWRVEKIQNERAQRAARRDAQAQDTLSAGELGPEQQGLIVSHFGTQVAVESTAGEILRCHLRANLEGLVTGDQVIWRAGEPMGVVVAQLPRDSELSRPDPTGKLRPVAANIDQIIIVLAPYPEPHANLIDRYLIAAEAVGIEPVILLNKVDLLAANTDLSKAMDELLGIYPGLDYRVIHSSIEAQDLDALEDCLNNRTSIFVGQSGVGKTSLINRLVPDAHLRVGALSETTRKGTHTTTTAVLLHLEGGGTLIDSPGIREFGLWHMDRETVEGGFREFRPFLGTCKFRDCHHQSEPRCALLNAVEAEKISERRLESYRHIVASLESEH